MFLLADIVYVNALRQGVGVSEEERDIHKVGHCREPGQDMRHLIHDLRPTAYESHVFQKSVLIKILDDIQKICYLRHLGEQREHLHWPHKNTDIQLNLTVFYHKPHRDSIRNTHGKANLCAYTAIDFCSLTWYSAACVSKETEGTG